MSKADFETKAGRFLAPPAPWTESVSRIWDKAWTGLNADWMNYAGVGLKAQMERAEKESEYARQYEQITKRP